MHKRPRAGSYEQADFFVLYVVEYCENKKDGECMEKLVD